MPVVGELGVVADYTIFGTAASRISMLSLISPMLAVSEPPGFFRLQFVVVSISFPPYVIDPWNTVAYMLR